MPKKSSSTRNIENYLRYSGSEMSSQVERNKRLSVWLCLTKHTFICTRQPKYEYTASEKSKWAIWKTEFENIQMKIIVRDPFTIISIYFG